VTLLATATLALSSSSLSQLQVNGLQLFLAFLLEFFTSYVTYERDETMLFFW
jgi:hypothetical protein